MVDRILPGAVILVYHRVANEPFDPQLLCVSPAHFDEHLQVIRRHCRPLGLTTLCSRYRTACLPTRSVVVTFDDGYADNLLGAAPILGRQDVPATVFVAGGFVEQTAEYWWDTLQRVLLTDNSLPKEFSITVGDTVKQWALGDVADYDSEKARNDSGWTVLSRETPTVRHEIYRFLCKTLKGMVWEQQQKLLGDLQQWAGSRLDKAARVAPRPPGSKEPLHPVRRALTPDEVVRLDQSGIVEVGSHTMYHARLSALSADAQKLEILQGKRLLEDLLGRDVETFAYPYGDRTDYTRETVRLVREAGFECACSNFEGHLYPWTDRFQLPRFLVRDWDGTEFERRLDEFLQAC